MSLPFLLFLPCMITCGVKFSLFLFFFFFLFSFFNAKLDNCVDEAGIHSVYGVTSRE